MSDAKELKGKSGIKRLINAFSYSKDGFIAAYRSEEAFRQEFWLLVIGAIIAAVLITFHGLSNSGWKKKSAYAN